MNKDEIAKAIVTAPENQQRMAKHIALKCFRNSLLEDLHSGKVPDSKTGDYSDVIVHTPFGQIPWSELSQFDNTEMKAPMVDVTNKVYHYIQELFDDVRGGELICKLAKKDPAPNWDVPK